MSHLLKQSECESTLSKWDLLVDPGTKGLKTYSSSKKLLRY